MRTVPFNDLTKHHSDHIRTFHELLDTLLKSSAFVGGKAIEDFEQEFAKTCGVSHAAGVGNGTDALYVALKAAGIGAGDQVLTVANTFIATTEAISLTGATPVFCDIDEETYGMDLDEMSRILDEDKDGVIKAVIPVHLYGQPVDLIEMRKRIGQRALIADAAQAHCASQKGKPIGALADFSSYSFYPGKNLGALGDAGAVVGLDQEKIEYIKSYCNHGRAEKHFHQFEGINSRLDTLQALFLHRKLSFLEQKTRRRQELARVYENLLKKLKEVKRPPIIEDRLSVFHLYVIEIDERDAVADALKEQGVGTGLHYPVPLHLQPAYKHLGLSEGALPKTEKAAKRILSLPLYPEMEDWEVPYVCETLEKVLRS